MLLLPKIDARKIFSCYKYSNSLELMSVVWKSSSKMGQNNSYERSNEKPQSQYYRSSQPRNSVFGDNSNRSWNSCTEKLVKKDEKTLQAFTNKGFEKK